MFACKLDTERSGVGDRLMSQRCLYRTMRLLSLKTVGVDVPDDPRLQRHSRRTTRLHFSLPIEGKVDCRGV